MAPGDVQASRPPVEAHGPPEAVAIGSRLELFVDRCLVERLDNAAFSMHQPEIAPPATPLRGAYMTIIMEGGRYRAYYRGYRRGYNGPWQDGNQGEITCYAESANGREWTFPDLGVADAMGPLGNNVVLAGMAPFSHNFSPFLDARPGVEVNCRFKALAGTHPDGLYAFESPDGIRWKKTGDKPVITSSTCAFDSQNVAFWSEAENAYVCFYRTWKTPHGWLRTISRTTSPDFLNWSEPVVMAPNLPGENLYTSQAHPYFRAPHIYVSLPTRLQEKRGCSTDILFMASRAGSARFERLFTEAFIRPGLDPERWGNRANYAALNVVPTGPAEMSIYHAHSGCRYVLRTDGFVSVRAGAAPGELLTRPLVFSGRELVVNFSASAAGSLRVEIQDAQGRPIPGFGLRDCPEVIGDEIKRCVRWNNSPDLASLAGRPVRLRFAMVECDLYSLRFV